MTAAEDRTLISEPEGSRRDIPGVALGALLGRGGMGEVFRGTQIYLQREVAVKFLTGTGAVDVSYAARFQREAKIVAGISHPHIVACYQAGTLAGATCYMVMEFVDGPNLKEWIDTQGPLPAREVLHLGRELAGALAHAHESGVIHRDVKPQNVLLGPVRRGQRSRLLPFIPKLADFGLARAAARKESLELTMPGTVMGTIATMAPEQYETPDRVDHRADIYGLGCILYFALAGESAFPGATPAAVFAAKQAELGPDPRVRQTETPAEIAAFVQRLLARDAAARPQSYEALIAECDRIIEVLWPAADTKPRLRVLWIAFLLVVSLGALVWYWPRDAANKESAATDSSSRQDHLASRLLELPFRKVVEGEELQLVDGIGAESEIGIIVAKQLDGIRVDIEGPERGPLTFRAPMFVAPSASRLTFEIDRSGSSQESNQKIEVEIKPVAGTDEITSGQKMEFFQGDGLEVLAGWEERDAHANEMVTWGSCDRHDVYPHLAASVSANTSDDITYRWRLLPRGEWTLRGKIEILQAQGETLFSEAGVLIECSESAALWLRLKFEDSLSPAEAALDRFKLRGKEPGWRSTVITEGETTLEGSVLSFETQWNGSALLLSFGDPGKEVTHRKLTIDFSKYAVDHRPGRLAIGARNASVCFSDFVIEGN